MTIEEYQALPWTVHGWAVRETAGDEPYYLVTVEELEGFSVVAESRAEAEALFPVVLKEYLAAAVESGNAPAVTGRASLTGCETARPGAPGRAVDSCGVGQNQRLS